MSLFLIYLKNSFSIINIKNYKDTENEKNKIEQLFNVKYSQTNSFGSIFEVGDNKTGIKDLKGNTLYTDFLFSTFEKDYSNPIEIDNKYFFILNLETQNHKFIQTIKTKRVCELTVDQEKNISLKELLNNEKCFSKDGVTIGAWWTNFTINGSSSFGSVNFNQTSIFTKKHNDFNLSCNLELSRNNSVNYYSHSFKRTWCKFMEEFNYENANTKKCLDSSERWVNILCLKENL